MAIRAPPPPAPRLALAKSCIADATSLRKARHIGTSKTNEWGATKMFFTAILEHYQVSVIHLHPNCITMLAIFAFWREAFVGISPSIALFCSYYSLHLTDPMESLGCLSFIHVPGRAFAPMSRLRLLPQFRGGWLFVDVRRIPHYDIPSTLPTRRRNWESVHLSPSGMEAREERIYDLEAMRLKGEMVAAEFLRQRVAPLQQHYAGMWALNSSSASLLLELALLPPDAVAAAVRLLLGVEQVPPLPPMATPLYDVPEEENTLARMPHFDQWGPCPLGTVRDNPSPFLMIGEEVSELEDEGIDPLQANVNPRAGGTLSCSSLGLLRRRVKASTPPSFGSPTTPHGPSPLHPRGGLS
ncbi:hypothetical protein QYE76_043029 [Lolium multiflorum]|uniref:Transposase (putative) gypsy type domain-containing protein n=1 Tax=Lolium multiflorum TaxID=4521 RepID=A0AAD8TIC0_LOLMU|nr:hypothetical protein QYE76_043029 [Lolium multiflorum]